MSKHSSLIPLNVDTSWKVASVFCLGTMLTMLPELVLASSSSDDGAAIGNTLCHVVGALQGRVGRGIATIAVVFLGIGLFLGKLSWGLAVAIGIGIGGIFGAQQIVEWLGGGTNGSAPGTGCATTSSYT